MKQETAGLDLEPIGETEEDRREVAFAAAPFWWKRIPLKALAIGREGDWLMHCRQIGLPPVAAAMRELDTFLPHAVRLLWFCANDESAWLAFWMKRAGSFLLDLEIRRWAEAQILPGEQGLVVGLALEIYDRAHATLAARVDTGDDDEPGERRGPWDARSTSRSSHGPSTAPSAPGKSSTGTRRKKGGRWCTATGSRAEGATSGPGRARRRKRKCGRGGGSEE